MFLNLHTVNDLINVVVTTQCQVPSSVPVENPHSLLCTGNIQHAFIYTWALLCSMHSSGHRSMLGQNTY